MKQMILVILAIIFLQAAPIDDAKALFNNNKYAEAIKVFKTIKNNPEAQYYLGKAYLYGMGVEKNVTKAAVLAKLSAEKDFPDGLNLMGVLYYYGDGMPKDGLEALTYYKKAAKVGSTKAMINLGTMYNSGTVIKKNLDKAFEWFSKAVKSGDPMGYFYIANTYYFDIKDYENAIKYYLKFLEEKKKDIPREVYGNLGDSYRHMKKFQESYIYYTKASKEGDDISMVSLSFLLDKHPKLAQFSDESLIWLERAAALKNKYAENFLFGKYLFDLNDPKKAKEFAEKSYKNGNKELGCKVSTLYSNVIFPFFDAEKAHSIANEVIKKSKPSSTLNDCYLTLANIYRNGWGVSQDPLKAIKILEKQYERTKGGDLQITGTIANIYLQVFQDFESAEKWYKITYDMTKDSEYLAKVDKYKATLPQFKKEKKKDVRLEVFPIIDNFNNEMQSTAVLESKEYYFLATKQKGIRIYNKKTLAFVRELRGEIGKGFDGGTLQMAYDENKNLLYCSGLNSENDMFKNEIIKVFNIDTGIVAKTVTSPRSATISYMDVSKDGKYLATIGATPLVNIINLETNTTQSYDYGNKTQLRALTIDKIADDYIVKVLGVDKKLYYISVKQRKQIKEENFTGQATFKHFNAKHAKKIFSKYKQNVIKNFTIKDKNIYIQMKNTKKFSFETLKLTSVNEKINFDNNKSSSAVEVKTINNHRTIQIYKNKILLTSLEFLTLHPMMYKVIDDKYIIVSVAESPLMMVFNFEGQTLANLSGAQATQTHTLYKDGYLISSGNDQIIHLWDLDGLNKLKFKNEYDPKIVASLNNFIGGNILQVFNDKQFIKEQGDNWAAQYSKKNQLPFVATVKQIFTNFKMLMHKKEEITPLASLYIKGDEWIIYNQKGIFSSSDNGKNLISYHVNQGQSKEAKIIKNDQLFEKFYRPDLIRKLLAKKKVNVDIDIRSVVFNIKPPEVTIVQYQLKDKKNLQITYQICDAGSGVSNVSLIINGTEKSLNASRGFVLEPVKKSKDRCVLLEDIITLEPGENKVYLQAFDQEKIIANESNEIALVADYVLTKKPQLHFVSIAVSSYKDKSLELKYAVKDVLAVEESIFKKSKNIFSKIHTYRLHDENVSKKKMKKLFDSISKKVEVGDAFILYIAGHGKTNDKDGLFYFLPYDTKSSDNATLFSQYISVNDIKIQLSKINTGKFLIMIDACNSGSFIDNANLSEEALNRLSHKNKRNYIVASSKTQVALEGYRGHGVFTYTVLKAFDKAYFPGDTKLTVKALADYVEKNVPKITKREFHYEQAPQTSLDGEEFPIVEKQK